MSISQFLVFKLSSRIASQKLKSTYPTLSQMQPRLTCQKWNSY